MIPYKTFAVIGGDLRQTHIANRLAAQGKTVYALLMEENTALNKALLCTESAQTVLPKCDAVILPLPLSTDDITIHAPFSKERLAAQDVFSVLRPQTAVFAGKVEPGMQILAEHYGISIVDYLDREELAVQNAAITAEGAVSLAIEETPIAIYGSNCLITGYGRIAHALQHILTAMGAHVHVCARRYSALAQARIQGCQDIPIDQLASAAAHADIIFNTVPAPLFSRKILSGMTAGALLIDLASKPGGEDLKITLFVNRTYVRQPPCCR